MKFWFNWYALWIVVDTVLRAYLYSIYPEYGHPVGPAEFLFGIVNATLSFIVAAGVLALFSLGGKWSLRFGVVLLVAVWLIIFVAEVFFWSEFESRLDRLVFHYLAYPKEVIVFLDEQFYVLVFVLPFALLVGLLVWMLGWPSNDASFKPYYWATIAAAVLIVAFATPLGASQSRIASEFASNGILGVIVDARYDTDDVPWLSDQASTDAPGYLQHLPRTGLSQSIGEELHAKRHVILIVEESFAGPVWRDQSLQQTYLPNFSALADASISFENLFATGNRTTRGLEAILNGFVPIPGISTTERAGFEKLPSLPRALGDGGFFPVFLYGGWPDFSNFSNYWSRIGYEKIWTRYDFEEEFETSWGVSDEALFDRLLTEMGQLTRVHDKVFLTTLTVSHHRPYTYPGGLVQFDPDERVSANAMAYADQALGNFIDQAKTKEWYPDTLFVVISDHGLQPAGDALIPATSYRIPMIIHGAGITPRTIDNLGSSMSLPKTLVQALGINTAEAFAGEDLFCGCDGVVPLEYGYHIGLLGREQMDVIDAAGEYHAWSFDLERDRLAPLGVRPSERVGSERVGRERDGGYERVQSYFAPAYQWFYEVD